jgi:membrane protein DedA with SNARE-associated domain
MEMTEQLSRHGATIVFANVLAQQLGLPIPVEPTLVVAGTLAAKGTVSPVRVVAAAVGATVLADATWFVVGRRYERKLESVLKCDRTPDAGDKDERGARFLRWGLRSLLLARFIPGAVQMIVPIAAARHAALASFLFYDLTGIVLWASLPVTGGMLFHHQAETLLHMLPESTVLICAAAVAATALTVLRLRSEKGRT